MDNKKLFRSRTDRMVGGVCAGLSQYVGVDVTIVRLFFILLAMAGNGIGLFIYFLLWIIVPEEGQHDTTLQENVQKGSEEIAAQARAMGNDIRGMVANPNPRAGLLVGSALIIAGLVFLVQNLNLTWLTWLDFDVIWPVLVIIGGIALLVRYFRGG